MKSMSQQYSSESLGRHTDSPIPVDGTPPFIQQNTYKAAGESRHKYATLSITYVIIFTVGLACMAVAGYFLIEGLSQFSGSNTARRMLIVGGVLFQVTESICFIAAAALTYHSLRWRYILFTLGSILFCFSIGVMTLAQKTALQSGEAQAQAIDEKRENLRKQIASLDQVIDSYRLNAERQSKSIYKDSRALGQDSINRATELEQKKFTLSEELYQLNLQRKHTAGDFFTRLEQISGLPRQSTEFYFLVIRSLLLELSGVILLSFGANLRAFNLLVREAKDKGLVAPVTSVTSVTDDTPSLGDTVADTSQNDKAHDKTSVKGTNRPVTNAKKPAENHRRKTNTAQAKPEHKAVAPEPKQDTGTESPPPSTQSHQLSYLATMAMDLYEQQLITEIDQESIRAGLSKHCGQKINPELAATLAKILNSRMDETC